MSPLFGPLEGGTVVTITGTGFGDVANTTVTFGGDEGTVDTVTATEITVTTPSKTAPGEVDIVVTVQGVSVTATQKFTYGFAPVVDSVDPDVGWSGGGQEVTIRGANFIDDDDLRVTIGTNTFEPTYVSDTELTAVTPGGRPARSA